MPISLISSLFSCVKPASVTEGVSEFVPSCVFCNVSGKRGFQVEWEDNEFIAFRDHDPAAVHHLLVIPKSHVESIRSLRKSDATLVQSMRDIGNMLLDNLDVAPSMRRMGFHIPPFNSVDHLHLHVQARPYKNWMRRAKYQISPGYQSYHKGYSWFVEVDQAIQILQDGREVSVSPS